MQAASAGNRAPARGGGASGVVLSSASDDDGAGFTALCASTEKHTAIPSAYVPSEYSIFGVAGKELFQHFPERGSYVQLGEDGQPA
jgi:hypothetical protein